jgi:uncharacterized repeat protein (TIGR01451 family)
VTRFAPLAICLLFVVAISPVHALESGGKQNRPDLAIDLLDAPDPVQPGRLLTYRVRVENRGTAPARDVAIATSVPSGTTFVALQAPRGWVATAPPQGAAGNVTFTLGMLPPGPPQTFLVTVLVPETATVGSTIANTATVTTSSNESSTENNAASAETTVDTVPPPVADLRVELDPFPAPVPSGGMLATMIIVHNDGPQAAVDVTVRAPIPQGSVFRWASTSVGSLTTPEVGGTGDLAVTVDFIPERRPIVISLVVEVTAEAGSRLLVRAEAAAATALDPMPNNNTTSALINVAPPAPEADLSVRLASVPDVARTGGPIVYAVTVENAGPAPALFVSVVARVPRGTRFGEAATTRGDLRTPPRGAPGAVGWRPGTIAPGESATMTFVVRVVANGGEPIEGGAIVTSISDDTNLADNTAAVSTRVQSAGEAVLQWDPPDEAGGDAPPPRNVVATPSSGSVGKLDAAAYKSSASARKSGETLVGYNVYSSTTPDPEPTEENLYTSVPVNQTTATVPVAPGGSFFTVTAEYTDGESSASNSDGAGDVAGATLTKVKMTTKINAVGSGFTDAVEVLLDGIPFVDDSKVKKSATKVVQKGTLLTGQTVDQYTEGGGTFLLVFRNSDGGTTVWEMER